MCNNSNELDSTYSRTLTEEYNSNKLDSTYSRALTEEYNISS